MRAIPDNNLRIPVLITLEDGSSASGFYYRSDNKNYFVTARHVLFKQDGAAFILRNKLAKLLSYPLQIEKTAPIELGLDLDKLNKNGNIRFHNSFDAAAVKIIDDSDKMIFCDGVNAKGTGALANVDATIIKKFNEVLVGNDVIIFGYPSSIGIKTSPQFDYQKPLIRKGVIAGLNEIAKTIIIDCPVYFGNSGGPAIEVEQASLAETHYRTIGLISQLIPFVEEWVSSNYNISNKQIENSGYSVVIPMDYVLELLDK